MLTKILQRAASHPLAYDLIQRLVGAYRTRTLLAARIAPWANQVSLILDIGGGTGMYRSIWRSDSLYVCLDLDPMKIAGFRHKYPRDMALLADAALEPFSANCVDAVVCTAMSHHLSDKSLKGLLAESVRVIKPTGRFVFMDAIWLPRRWMGRLLWKYDRGSNPRTAEALQQMISEFYQIEHQEQFAIYHEYLVCIAKKR